MVFIAEPGSMLRTESGPAGTCLAFEISQGLRDVQVQTASEASEHPESAHLHDNKVSSTTAGTLAI